VPAFVGFCSHCGNDLSQDDRECRACGADTIDANVIVLLKRISSRRSLRDREGDSDGDTFFPL